MDLPSTVPRSQSVAAPLRVAPSPRRTLPRGSSCRPLYAAAPAHWAGTPCAAIAPEWGHSECLCHRVVIEIIEINTGGQQNRKHKNSKRNYSPPPRSPTTSIGGATIHDSDALLASSAGENMRSSSSSSSSWYQFIILSLGEFFFHNLWSADPRIYCLTVSLLQCHALEDKTRAAQYFGSFAQPLRRLVTSQSLWLSRSSKNNRILV